MALIPGSASSMGLLVGVAATGSILCLAHFLNCRRQKGGEGRAVPDGVDRITISSTALFCGGASLLLGVEAIGLFGVPISFVVLFLGVLWILYLFFLGRCVFLALSLPGATKLCSRIGMLTGSLLMSLLVVEGILDGVVPKTPYEISPNPGHGSLYREEVLLPNLLTPGFKGKTVHPDFPGIPVSTNSHGFRDREWGPPGEARRFLVLGDSFAFGLGVHENQTFSRIMEKNWEHVASGSTLRAYSMGVPGYSPSSEFLLLRSHFDRIEPELVIMVFYTGNDIQGELYFADRLSRIDQRRRGLDISAGEGPDTNHASLPGLESAWLEDYLPYAGRVSKSERERVKKKRESLFGTLGSVRKEEYWTKKSGLYRFARPRVESLFAAGSVEAAGVAVSPIELTVLESPLHEDVIRGLGYNLGAIEAAREYCRKRGARFLLVLAPMRFQAEDVMFNEYFARNTLVDPGRYDRGLLHQTLGSECDERGIVALDLLPAIQSATRDGGAFYHREGHWNVSGHRLAAREILRYLKSLEWL